jgi:hypothetical protein
MQQRKIPPAQTLLQSENWRFQEMPCYFPFALAINFPKVSDHLICASPDRHRAELDELLPTCPCRSFRCRTPQRSSTLATAFSHSGV